MRATLPFTALLLAGMVCIVAGAEALRGSEPILENDDNYGGCAVSQTSPRCLINCAETMDSLSAITYTVCTRTRCISLNLSHTCIAFALNAFLSPSFPSVAVCA